MEIHATPEINDKITAILIRPDDERGSVFDFSLVVQEYKTNEETGKQEFAARNSTFDDDIKEILNIKDPNKFPLYIQLAQPLTNYLMACNPDMFDDDSKYNYGYCGTPIFGNIVILENHISSNQEGADKDSLITEVSSMSNITAQALLTFFECDKREEKLTGIRDMILKEIEKVGKQQFLKNILNDNAEAGNIEMKNTNNENK